MSAYEAPTAVALREERDLLREIVCRCMDRMSIAQWDRALSGLSERGLLVADVAVNGAVAAAEVTAVIAIAEREADHA